jgi:4-amino-4-deoxy-L-arabinose transferase-like glycosyltransferase
VLEPQISAQQSSRWFLGALVIAASVRVYLLWQYYCISSDGVVYIRTAQDFYRGRALAALGSVYPPGYPLLIAAVFPFVGHWELAGQLLSAVLGVLLLVPLYWIFSEVFNRRVGLLACFLAGISPFLALYSVHVRSESTYIFFSSLALYLFLTGIERKRKGRFFWGGLIAGYAYLVRPEAIAFLVIIPAIASLRWISWHRNNLPEFTHALGLLCLGFMVCALPYIVYLSIDTGRFSAISRKAGITLRINLQESGMLEAEDNLQGEGLNSFAFTDYILRHPFRYSKKVAADLVPAIGVFFEALHYSYVPFLLLGLFLVLRERFWAKPELLLLGFICFYVFGFALIYVKRRYSLQAVPISLGLVAIGIWHVWNKMQAVLSAQKAALAGACISIIFLGATLPKTLKAVSREKAYVRETGWYLKERNPTGVLRVAVFDDRITFYANALTLPLAGIQEADLSAKLHQQRADYFAAESKIFHKAYPEVATAPDRYGLLLEKMFVGTRRDEMLLFKVI